MVANSVIKPLSTGVGEVTQGGKSFGILEGDAAGATRTNIFGDRIPSATLGIDLGGGGPPKDKPKQLEGMAPWAANSLAMGQIGLGAASYFENRKTAKVQRASLRHNLEVAKEEQALRKERRASWNNAFSG